MGVRGRNTGYVEYEEDKGKEDKGGTNMGKYKEIGIRESKGEGIEMRSQEKG